MKDQFAYYETAKMLKELAYKGPCFRYWDSQKRLFVGEWQDYYESDLDIEILAPTWQQIKQWLWDSHKIHIEAEFDYGGREFCFFIYQQQDSNFVGLGLHNDEVLFKTPIMAEIEGIKQAVKYLHDKK